MTEKKYIIVYYKHSTKKETNTRAYFFL